MKTPAFDVLFSHQTQENSNRYFTSLAPLSDIPAPLLASINFCQESQTSSTHASGVFYTNG